MMRTASPSSSPTRRLQLALAALWAIDALLQLQPANFGPQLVYQTILSNATHQPQPILGSLVDAATLLAPQHVALNIAIATVELALAAGLLWGRRVRLALGASIVWALGVWWLGEGFGGLFAGEATLLAGAPGAALLYALLALVAWPVQRTRAGAQAASRRPPPTQADPLQSAHATPQPCTTGSRAPTTAGGIAPAAGRAIAPAAAGALGERRTLACWSALWIGGAVLRVVPFWFGPVYALRADLTCGLDEEPRWMMHIGVHLSALAGQAGLPLVIALAVLEAAIGALALTSHRRAALAAGAVLSVIYWAAGQQFGGLLTGSATDVGAGPLYLLLAWSLWRPRPARRAGIIATCPAEDRAPRSVRPRRSATRRLPPRWPPVPGRSCAPCAARR